MNPDTFIPGWIPFLDRTADQNIAHANIVDDMPKFRVFGSAELKPSKLLLTDFWTAPQVVSALGYPYERIHQLTGSCVGAGGGNTAFTLSAIEVVRLNDPEQIIVPFWLLPYGISRKLAGMRGRGEGSLGSTFAKAVQQYGFIDARLPGLPAFTNADGLTWASKDEYAWSDGNAISSTWLEQAAKRTVKTVSPCTSADNVRDAILNYYPVTCACDNFVGSARVQGDILTGSFDRSGGHQTSILGWWEHPSLGEMFLYQNQWPASVYPKDPGGGPACSVWISKKSMDWACKTGEVYAFSQYDGYPAQTIRFRPFGT
jgi:hypothetical protein